MIVLLLTILGTDLRGLYFNDLLHKCDEAEQTRAMKVS